MEGSGFMKLSDYIMAFIAAHGVKHVFMLPGGGAMHLVDSLGKNRRLRYTCNLHEQACAIAADAYSQYTNSLSVSLVTTGPGGTNTITGVAASWLDSIPVMFISGQVKRADMIGTRKVRQIGFQEIDIVSIVRPITKYAVTVTNPDDIRFHLEKGLYLAQSDRPGPVWIDVPLDVQAAMIDERMLQSYKPPTRRKHPPVKRAATSAIRMLNNAERPVILAGNGIRLSGSLKTFRQLIKTLDVPVLTTWKAMDLLPETHPLYAGRPGSIGQRGANFAQQNADLILVLGARLDLGQTAYNHKNFARAAMKIMVDIDPYEIRKMDTTIDLAVEADVALFIEELLRRKSGLKRKDHTPWLSRCKEWQKRYPVVLAEYGNQKHFVNDYVLINVLSDEMRADDLMIPGSSGACSERTMQAFRVKEGQRVFNSEGLGSMGFGIPMAIGGCIASGRKRTVCIDGDGGFAMNIQELEVVRRENLPIKFFVLNNQGYVSIQMTQKNYFNSRFVASTRQSGLTLPDYKKLAKAFGIPVFQLKNHKDIRAKVRKILNTRGPVVCEVMVSPDQTTAPRISSKQQADGSMVTLPMEDLWPFLDREELERNMDTSRM